MADESKATEAEKAYAAAVAKIPPQNTDKTAAPKVKPALAAKAPAEPASPAPAAKANIEKAASAKTARAKPAAKTPARKKTSSGKVTSTKATSAKTASAKKVATKAATQSAKPAGTVSATRKTAAKGKPPAKPAQARSRKTASTAKPTTAAIAKLLKPTDEPTLTELKEKIMATAKNSPDLSNIVTDLKDKAKTAYEKTTAAAGDAGEFAKGNIEAMVESGKIFASGIQSMGRDYVEESKSGFETITADMKKIAAVKSPTEFFQLQGELIRRNIDTAIAFSSKSSEKMVKLSNDTIAPISSRVSVAVDKVSKTA